MCGVSDTSIYPLLCQHIQLLPVLLRTVRGTSYQVSSYEYTSVYRVPVLRPSTGTPATMIDVYVDVRVPVPVHIFPFFPVTRGVACTAPTTPTAPTDGTDGTGMLFSPLSRLFVFVSAHPFSISFCLINAPSGESHPRAVTCL